jgi:predicted O-methyltransferase YrrM
MSPLRFQDGIDGYVEAHTTPVADYLRELAAVTSEMPGAPMLSGPVEGRLLETLAWITRARLAVDVGTFTGNSAISMAGGLAEGGRVITCDVNAETLAIARKFIDASPYADRIDVREGPALDTIATIEGPIDLVFIDADKTNYRNYYEAVLPKLADRGLIAVDNTLWSGRVADPRHQEPDTVALRDFNACVGRDERVDLCLVPIADGLTLLRKR